VEHADTDPLGARRILITGAGGQLGAALAEVFPDAEARTRAELDAIDEPRELPAEIALAP